MKKFCHDEKNEGISRNKCILKQHASQEKSKAKQKSQSRKKCKPKQKNNEVFLANKINYTFGLFL